MPIFVYEFLNTDLLLRKKTLAQSQKSNQREQVYMPNIYMRLDVEPRFLYNLILIIDSRA